MDIMNFVQTLAAADVCGELTGSTKIWGLLETVIQLIKIVVPILLIIWGMIDLGKAVIAQKEDEIKKGQQTFMKRAIAAVLVFFIPTIIGIILGVVGEDDIYGCLKDILV